LYKSVFKIRQKEKEKEKEKEKSDKNITEKN
jgi:hypothetical protein